MKFNAQTRPTKTGMTLLELTVVILVLLSLISILFVASRAWKRGADRSANLLNIRNCQQAMRGEENLKKLMEGDPFVQSDLEEYMLYPAPVNATIGAYTNTGAITPASAKPAEDWNHIWLIPGTPGLPGESYGHNSYEQVTGW